MRENDNHPLTLGTYDDGIPVAIVEDSGWRGEVLDQLHEVIRSWESNCPWLSPEEACVQLIHLLR